MNMTYEQTALISVFNPETNNYTNSREILKRPVMPDYYQKDFKYGAEELKFEVIEDGEKVIYSFDDRGEIRATSATKQIVWRSRPSYNEALKICSGHVASIRSFDNGALEFTYEYGTYYFGPYMDGKTFENYTFIEPSYDDEDDACKCETCNA